MSQDEWIRELNERTDLLNKRQRDIVAREKELMKAEAMFEEKVKRAEKHLMDMVKVKYEKIKQKVEQYKVYWLQKEKEIWIAEQEKKRTLFKGPTFINASPATVGPLFRGGHNQYSK